MVGAVETPGSPRRVELLEAAYAYALEHGLADLSLRPLARATGTSPRVLLYLFGSKDELVAEILARAREEQRALVAAVLDAPAPAGDRFAVLVDRLWEWLAAPAQRATIRLFFEAYARSLRPEPGPWANFAADSVGDWLELLVAAQSPAAEETARLRATRTLALLRGLLLDLVACEDEERVHGARRFDAGRLT